MGQKKKGTDDDRSKLRRDDVVLTWLRTIRADDEDPSRDAWWMRRPTVLRALIARREGEIQNELEADLESPDRPFDNSRGLSTDRFPAPLSESSLSTREVAAYFGFQWKTLQRWRTRGYGPRWVTERPLPYTKVSNSVCRYRKDDLEAFVESCVVRPTSRP